MSWLKNNYHIAALGGGALALAGLAFAAKSSYDETTAELGESSVKKQDVVTVDGQVKLTSLSQSLTDKDDLRPAKTVSGRPLNLFTSVDLFTPAGKPGEIVDLLQMDGQVHPPIPNSWWVDNQINPAWSDSPGRDQDGDGFTNLDEFQAKTDPNDPESYGDLATKVEVVSVKSDLWRVEFNSEYKKTYQFNFLFKTPEDQKAQRNRMRANDAVKVGDTFFKGDPGKGRFKLLRIDSRMQKTSFGEEKRNWAVLEDQLENKKENVYEIPYAMKRDERPVYTYFDHVVTFRLNAIDKAEENFEVAENETFSLPSGKDEKPYRVVGVKLDDSNQPQSVSIQWEAEGKTKTREISLK